jgi:hypothetical protein
MHSSKTYGCCSKLALNPDPGRETQICCCAVVQVVVYMLYMLVGRSSRLFTIPQAILMYVYVRLQWESPSSSPLVVLERLVIRSSCIGSLRSSCTGETSWREWLHIATKKISCWNFDYVLDPPWERWLCGKHFISKLLPLFWTGTKT